MFTFVSVLLAIIAVISALLLVCIILMQNTKSGGGLGAVSGGVTETVFGTQAASVLVKCTVWLALIFMISTLMLAIVIGRGRKSQSVIELLGEGTPVEINTTIPAAETAPAAEAPAAETAPAAAETAPAAAETAPAAAETAPAAEPAN